MALVRRLELIRQIIGKTIVIASGCRCPAYNKKVGGVPDSAHLKGKAADVYVPNSRFRFSFLNWAFSYFRRIGVGQDFIHVDIDDEKPINVCWTYPIKAKDKGIGGQNE